MDDNIDFIARLYPHNDSHQYARKAIEGSSLHIPPTYLPKQPPKPIKDRKDRETTEPPEDDEEEDLLRQLPCIELKFSHLPRTSLGLMFGTDPRCDVVLPTIPGASAFQFAFTYKNSFSDKLYRLTVRDYSKHGTCVTYGSKGKVYRTKFDWVVHGFGVPNKSSELVIKVRGIQFRLFVHRQNLSSPSYIEKVQRFCAGRSDAEHLLDALHFQSLPTTLDPSLLTSRNEGRVAIPIDRLGSGTSGEVVRCWDVSDGMEYALKRPRDGVPVDQEGWQQEIELMRGLARHDNIIQLIYAEAGPKPRIYLEFMPYGSLAKQAERAPFSLDEYMVMLHQCASALNHLHGLSPPMAHRDIKAENVLVKYRDLSSHRDPNRVIVKLSDFGLAKTEEFESQCGTPWYMAPEVWLPNRYYSVKVDCWALGLVMLEYAYTLPEVIDFDLPIEERPRYIVSYLRNLRRREPFIEILRRMLIIEPDDRIDAAALFGLTSMVLERRRNPHLPQNITIPPNARAPQDLRFGNFRIASWNGEDIAYMPYERKINATHLVSIINHSLDSGSRQLTRFLKHRPYITAEQNYDGPKHGENKQYPVKGRYLTYEDALEFCDVIGLSQDLIRRLMGAPQQQHQQHQEHQHTMYAAQPGRAHLDPNPGLAGQSRQPPRPIPQLRPKGC
ncbi:kinase-like domain-containing protein [Astrocystis sublimbata]|nr:kinase-like domain-containing protein [Astrocystis sublimbata]